MRLFIKRILRASRRTPIAVVLNIFRGDILFKGVKRAYIYDIFILFLLLLR